MLNKKPEQMIVCNLECIVMPNGEVISKGKTIGWFEFFKEFLTEKGEE